MQLYIYNILVGGLEHFFFPYIGLLIIPTDFHIFQRGSNHQAEYIYIYYTAFVCWASSHLPKILEARTAQEEMLRARARAQFLVVSRSRRGDLESLFWHTDISIVIFTMDMYIYIYIYIYIYTYIYIHIYIVHIWYIHTIDISYSTIDPSWWWYLWFWWIPPLITVMKTSGTDALVAKMEKEEMELIQRWLKPGATGFMLGFSWCFFMLGFYVSKKPGPDAD